MRLLAAVGLLIVMVGTAGVAAIGSGTVWAQGEMTPKPAEGEHRVYNMIEWVVPVDVQVENPFDPEQIEVNGIFTAPDGTEVNVPGFWMQPYRQTCRVNCTVEQLEPDGSPEWHIRFAPTIPGSWRYAFQVRENNGFPRTVETGEFAVAAAPASGFVRVADNERYFAFEDGTAFFPIGHNLAWSWEGAGGTLAYVHWLEQLAASGGNYARLYIDTPWFIGFEWRSAPGDFSQAQDDFWRLDTILQAAEELGIYLDLVILWHQGLANYNGVPILVPEEPARADTSADWRSNPYNVLNGGFLTSTTQFFTEQRARLLFRWRLRYLVARWGYSPHVFAWDLLSAADRVVGYNPTIVLPWLEEMAAYLRDIDPYDHLITIGSAEAPLELLDAPGIDFGQVRFYQRRPLADPEDQVLTVVRQLDEARRRTSRPILLTEFSLSPWLEPAEEDPEGVHVANTMWASMMAGAAGAGGSWWWDTYLIPNGLFALQQPLSAFAGDIPWNWLRLNPVQLQVSSDRAEDFSPLVLDDFDRRFLADDLPLLDVPIRVTPDGPFPRLNLVSAFLYGQTYNNQQRVSRVFTMSFPVDTRLTIRVASSSRQANALLVVRLDGDFLASLALETDSSSVAMTVRVPAGRHVLEMSNEGDDWLQLESIAVEHYVPALRSLALADPSAGVMLAWFQNRAYDWQTPEGGGSVTPFQAELQGMASGSYRVEFIDPETGRVIGEDRVEVGEEGILRLALLPVARSLAVKATLSSGPVILQTATAPVTAPPAVAESPAATATGTVTQASATPTPRATRTPVPTRVSSFTD
ncbi:MAG: hypothetical protein Kow0077_18350 [Anaerolineae bacterium]